MQKSFGSFISHTQNYKKWIAISYDNENEKKMAELGNGVHQMIQHRKTCYKIT